jgi:branched-chain amino acid transport system ATP-binding protein
MTIVEIQGAAADVDLAVDVAGLSSGYGQTQVLRDISFSVRAGSVTALVGANGAGKSTLLKTVSGIVTPSAGTIRMFGQDVTRQPTHRRVTLGMRHVPEGRAIYRSLSVKENLTMQCVRGTEVEFIERVVQSFPILGERLSQRSGTLSGGEQQMLALASAHARGAKLILVDEPSLGLAPKIVDLIFEFLHEISRHDVALLVVDQYVNRVLEIADHAYVLRRGTLVYDGGPDALADSDMFAQYMGTD